MQLDDVQAFFRTYYHPANASLALAGDIETERAFELAGHYFGDLEAGWAVRPEIVIERQNVRLPVRRGRRPEISAKTLEKVVQYFHYKLRYTNHAGQLPEFKIDAEQALELLMAANFLDT